MGDGENRKVPGMSGPQPGDLGIYGAEGRQASRQAGMVLKCLKDEETNGGRGEGKWLVRAGLDL